ncbi:MAG: DJ-1/PfpI family protein [bacterium]|nr:DJ-1/PfpI family protein [bacterium]
MGRYTVILLIALFFVMGCDQAPINEPIQENETIEEEVVEMKNVLFIIAQNNFRDEELNEPKKILESAGHNVDVASLTMATAKGMLGMLITPDLTVNEALAKVENYDMVVVVGGSGSPSLADYPEVLSLLKKADEKEKELAGICLGPMTMAKAGVLSGKNATVFNTDDSLDALRRGGAKYTAGDLVEDERLVTASGPEASTQFGEKLAEILRG